MKKRFRVIMFLLILLIILEILGFCAYYVHSMFLDVDKVAMRYDANGPFVVLNKTTGILGFYDGIRPCAHCYVNCDVIPFGDYEMFRSANCVIFRGDDRNVKGYLLEIPNRVVKNLEKSDNWNEELNWYGIPTCVYSEENDG